MESIITGQKVARRRPYLPIAAPRDSGSNPLAFQRPSSRKIGSEARRPAAALGRGYADRPLELGGEALFRSPLGGQRPRPRTAPFLRQEEPRRQEPRRRRNRDSGGRGLRALWSLLRGQASRLAQAAGARTGATLAGAARPGATFPGTAIPSPAAFQAPSREEGLRRASILAGGTLLLILAGAGLYLAFAPPVFPLPETGLLPAENSGADLLLSYLSPELAEAAPEEGLDAPPPPKTLEVATYKVRPGDNLGGIAKRYGLSIDSLISMNGVKNATSLKAGTELRVPNMDGLVHVVAKGESLGGIAKRYKVEVSLLADANDLGTSVVRPGQSIFVPGAKLPEAERKRFFGTSVIWPVRGTISSYYGYRADPFSGVRRFHAAIDIVAAPGIPVKAAMDGRVADRGYNSVYGNYVILTHADGVQTMYAHLMSYSVAVGKTVAQGAVIGLVGNTGYSTGPHLHFGIFKRGQPTNPLKMLK